MVGSGGTRRSPLLTANVVLLATIFVHGADHFRQGLDGMTRHVFWGGIAVNVLAFASFLITLRGHPKAHVVAAVVGFYIAAVVTGSHVLPHWSVFSYSYPDLGVDVWSWIAALAEVVAAAALGVIGLRGVRGTTPSPA